MQGMGWSWRQLAEETPPYVRRFCLDLLSVKRRIAKENADRPPG